jgi:hypothetical protein
MLISPHYINIIDVGIATSYVSTRLTTASSRPIRFAQGRAYPSASVASPSQRCAFELLGKRCPIINRIANRAGPANPSHQQKTGIGLLPDPCSRAQPIALSNYATTRLSHYPTIALPHSYLSASIGFSRAARSAGYSPAANPTAAETPEASSTVTSEMWAWN